MPRDLKRWLVIGLWLFCLLPGLVAADDCSTPSDCEETAGYNMAFSLIGGLIALMSGFFSNLIAGITGSIPPRYDESRPDWSLARRPGPDYEWDPETEQWVKQEDTTDYRDDRPEWSLLNRPSPDHEWDHDQEKWVLRTEERYRRKMEKQGYEFDENTMAYRKRPEDIAEIRLQREVGDVTRPKLIPGWFTYDESYQPLADRFSYLDDLEKNASDALENIERQLQEANEAGDVWLAEQLLRQMSQAERNVQLVRNERDGLNDRIQEKAENRRKYQKKIENWKLKDLGWELLRLPWDMLTGIFSKKDPLLEDAMVNAYRARNQLQKDLDEQPELFRRHTEQESRLKELNRQIQDARSRGDTETEQRLRREAEPVKDKMRELSNRINQIHESSSRWKRKASIANLMAYRKGAEMIMDGQQVRHTSKTVNNIIDQHRRGNLPWQNRSRMTASGGGGDGLPLTTRGLSTDELELDRMHNANASRGARRVDNWSKSFTEGTEGDHIKATMEALEDYQSKLQMKDAKGWGKRQWNESVRRCRDNPLFEEMSQNASKRDWVVKHPEPDLKEGYRYRAVTEEDFGRFSSSSDPGIDMDVKYNQNIIDTKTGKPVKFNQVQDLIDESCSSLEKRYKDSYGVDVRIDPRKQEIHAVGPGHREAYRVPEGLPPDQAISPSQVRKFSSMDGEHAYRISEDKRISVGPYDAADHVSHQCRTAIKDYKRITQPRMETTQAPLRRPSWMTDESLDIMEKVGNGNMPPGTGNARFRQLTGMDLDEGCRKLNSLQEAVPVLDKPHLRKDATIPDQFTTAAERAEIGDELARRGEPSHGHIKAASAQEKAQILQRGETPETFGRQVGPEVDDRSFWKKYDEAHGLDKRGVTHLTGEEKARYDKFWEDHPDLAEIDNKINTAWQRAQADKLDQMRAQVEAELDWEGVPRDHPDYSPKLDERMISRSPTRYDCYNEFQNNIQDMVSRGELGPTDYDKWMTRISTMDAPPGPVGTKIDVAVADVSEAGTTSAGLFESGPAPSGDSFSDKLGDFYKPPGEGT